MISEYLKKRKRRLYGKKGSLKTGAEVARSNRKRVNAQTEEQYKQSQKALKKLRKGKKVDPDAWKKI